ncbi:MAG: hypothetical protein LBJ25_06840 [Candidatus Margulisbacteria bacterium]|nr:hypothetical protein [Candidatus Margulisiibacteriota bacterium]
MSKNIILVMTICVFLTIGCANNVNNYNKLLFENNILYFQNKIGKFIITDEAHQPDYDVSNNIVVYASNKNGKLYLYNHLDKKVKLLNSPAGYYCSSPKIYNDEVFYTVLEKPELFYWPSDPYPSYLYVTNIKTNSIQPIIYEHIDMYSLQEYKNLFILKDMEFGNLGLLLFDPNTKRYIKIYDGLPNDKYIVKGNKIFSINQKEIVSNLDYWAEKIEKQ